MLFWGEGSGGSGVARGSFSFSLSLSLSLSSIFDYWQQQKTNRMRGIKAHIVMPSNSMRKNKTHTLHYSGFHTPLHRFMMRTLPTKKLMKKKKKTEAKIDAVRGYGGMITFCEPTLQARLFLFFCVCAWSWCVVVMWSSVWGELFLVCALLFVFFLTKLKTATTNNHTPIKKK